MAFDVQTPGKKRSAITPAMNVTPLVDVVLVLLIIFMVVTPLLTKQMSMTVPGKPDDAAPPPPASAQPLPPVVLTVGQGGETKINRELIERAQLVDKLQRMLNARADKIVFFDAGDDVPYAVAMGVLDQLRGGGITQIAVAPEKIAE